MSIRFFLAPFLGFLVISIGVAVSAEPSEAAKRLKQAEADLKKSRESLHVAHQELGEKADVIAKLKSELEKSPGIRRKKSDSEAHNKLKRELQVANAKIRTLEKKLESVEKKQETASKTAESKQKRAGAAPGIFKVNYDSNSAASFDGRVLALEWIKGRLKKDPDKRFAIRGRANDTEFEKANHAIAENRANFLASFFRVSGVPSDAIVKVSGQQTSEIGAGGRIVEVFELP